MNYKEVGFRPLYHSFCVFNMIDFLKDEVFSNSKSREANCLLTYGYIDYETGFRLEVLAMGYNDDEGCEFFDIDSESRAFIKIETVLEEEFFILEDEDNALKIKYAERIEMLNLFNVSQEIEEIRGFAFIDEQRHPMYPDDIMVYFFKDGADIEKCWVRAKGLGDGFLTGILLNEPYQNFGCHKGDEVVFVINKLENDDLICIAKIN